MANVLNNPSQLGDGFLALPAMGLDRCDGGITNVYGTFTPTTYVKINSSDGVYPSFHLEERSDSPKIESGEQVTVVHRYYADYNTALIILQGYPRGTIVQDSGINTGGMPLFYRVLSTTFTTLQKSNGWFADIEITSEGLWSPPPDEFTVDPVELNPSIEKHQRYGSLTYLDRYNIRQQNITDQPDLGQLYQNVLSTITDTVEYDQAQELLFKKHKGVDSFYLAGWKISWSQYYYNSQILNPGGYIEDPVAVGGLPVQFWSDDGTVDGNNIFGFAGFYNPNMFPTNNLFSPNSVSWLRQADQQVLQRTWFRVTRSWLGSGLGNWDFQLYTSYGLPYQTSEDDGNIYSP